MIVLLTDFGSSEALGVMKGVIRSYTSAEIVDLYHYVQSQQVKQGAWILLQAYKYFPNNTIFVCVVDPEVGSQRKAVVVQSTNYVFIGPDNGLLYPAAVEDGIQKVMQLSTEGASKTFHGRDVFAKAAGMLKNGRLTGWKITLQPYSFYLQDREGEVVHIDYFGNVITNLSSLHKDDYEIFGRYMKYYSTYANAPDNELFLITGSAQTLEISLKNGNANELLKLNIGDKISIN